MKTQKWIHLEGHRYRCPKCGARFSINMRKPWKCCPICKQEMNGVREQEAECRNEVPGSTEIKLSYPAGGAGVYVGPMPSLERVQVKPHTEGEGEYRTEWLTLDEIAEQVKQPIITVITDSPLYGEIYTYGNYGDYWVKSGEHKGYA